VSPARIFKRSGELAAVQNSDVMPAQAGIHLNLRLMAPNNPGRAKMDSRFRGNDDLYLNIWAKRLTRRLTEALVRSGFRHRDVPRIGGFIADSRSVPRLCRGHFIVGCGWKPNPTIIQERQSGRHC
jgi:hypothetical protein